MTNKKQIKEKQNLEKEFNKLIIHKKFNETLEEINRLNVSLPKFQSDVAINQDVYGFLKGG